MSSLDTSLSMLPTRRAVNWRRFSLLGIGTVIAAVVANTLLYFIGGALISYDPDFFILADVYGPISFTLVPAVGAVLLYAALLRFTHRPARIFTIVSALVLVLTVIPDFIYVPTVSGWTSAQIAMLLTMHLAAACVIVRLLTMSERLTTQKGNEPT